MNKINIASVDIDPQKGFTPLCPKELPVEDGQNIVEDLLYNHSLSSFRVVSRDLHPNKAMWNAEKPENQFEKVDEDDVDLKWNSHCVHGTYGAELLDGLPHPIKGYDYSVIKGTEKDMHPYGACYHDLSDKISTGLIEVLKVNKIDVIIVGGLATDYCVYKTVTQLLNAGFKIILNLNSCRGIAEKSTNEALDDLNNNSNCLVVKDLKKENINKLLNKFDY